MAAEPEVSYSVRLTSQALARQPPDDLEEAERGTIFVPWPKPPRVGTKVVVELGVAEDAPTKLGALVVWSRPPRPGIIAGFRARLEDPSPDLRGAIREIVKLARQSAANREADIKRASIPDGAVKERVRAQAEVTPVSPNSTAWRSGIFPRSPSSATIPPIVRPSAVPSASTIPPPAPPRTVSPSPFQPPPAFEIAVPAEPVLEESNDFVGGTNRSPAVEVDLELQATPAPARPTLSPFLPPANGLPGRSSPFEQTAGPRTLPRAASPAADILGRRPATLAEDPFGTLDELPREKPARSFTLPPAYAPRTAQAPPPVSPTLEPESSRARSAFDGSVAPSRRPTTIPREVVQAPPSPEARGPYADAGFKAASVRQAEAQEQTARTWARQTGGDASMAPLAPRGPRSTWEEEPPVWTESDAFAPSLPEEREVNPAQPYHSESQDSVWAGFGDPDPVAVAEAAEAFQSEDAHPAVTSPFRVSPTFESARTNHTLADHRALGPAIDPFAPQQPAFVAEESAPFFAAQPPDPFAIAEPPRFAPPISALEQELFAEQEPEAFAAEDPATLAPEQTPAGPGDIATGFAEPEPEPFGEPEPAPFAEPEPEPFVPEEPALYAAVGEAAFVDQHEPDTYAAAEPFSASEPEAFVATEDVDHFAAQEPEPFSAEEPIAFGEPEPFPADPEQFSAQEPAVFGEPEPFTAQEPGPFSAEEPAFAEPEPFAAQEPEALADEGLETLVAQEPGPFTAPEQEVFAGEEPGPFAAQEPDPVASEDPEAFAAQESEPFAAQEPEAFAGEPEPFAAQEPEPFAAQEPEPFAAQEPEPFAAQEPEPLAGQESEPLAAEPFAAQEPEPFAAQEPEPFAAQEPEPFAAQEPEPFAAQEPEPFEAQESEPFAAQEPEAFAAQEPEPFAAQDPEAFAGQEPEPFPAQEPEPFAAQEPEPFAAQEPEPFAAQEPEPFAAQEPEPFAGQEPEAFAAQEVGPFVAQEPEVFAGQEPEPFAAQEPEHFAAQEPEAFAAQESEPSAAQEPEHFARQEPAEFVAQEPEPFAAQEPEVLAAQEPGPFAWQESESLAAQEPETLEPSVPEAFVPTEGEPPVRDAVEPAVQAESAAEGQWFGAEDPAEAGASDPVAAEGIWETESTDPHRVDAEEAPVTAATEPPPDPPTEPGRPSLTEEALFGSDESAESLGEEISSAAATQPPALEPEPPPVAATTIPPVRPRSEESPSELPTMTAMPSPRPEVNAIFAPTLPPTADQGLRPVVIERPETVEASHQPAPGSVSMPALPRGRVSVTIAFSSARTYRLHYERFFAKGQVYVAELPVPNSGSVISVTLEVPDGQDPLTMRATVMRPVNPPEVPRAGWLAVFVDRDGKMKQRLSRAAVDAAQV